MNSLDILQTIVLVVGTGYAIFEYWRIRKFRPRIEFDLDFSMAALDAPTDHYLLIIELSLENKGSVRKYLPEVGVLVQTLDQHDTVEAAKSKQELAFKKTLISSHNIVTKPADPWWIDAGVSQVFRYPLVVAKPNTFIKVSARFFYYRFHNSARGSYKLYKKRRELKRAIDNAKQSDTNNNLAVQKRWDKFNRDKVDYHKASRIKSVSAAVGDLKAMASIAASTPTGFGDLL